MNESCPLLAWARPKRSGAAGDRLRRSFLDSKVEGRSLSLAKQKLQADCVSPAAKLLSINLHTDLRYAHTNCGVEVIIFSHFEFSASHVRVNRD